MVDELYHANYYVGKYNRERYQSAIASRGATKESKGYKKTKEIVGRKTPPGRMYRYGNYKSPYYDPVARHERYLRERESLGIGKGIASITSIKSSSKGSGKGRSGKGSGKGGSGRGGSGKGSGGSGTGGNSLAGMAEEIAKLREESLLNTEAQREAARRKIEDLQNELKAHIETLQKNGGEEAEGFNVTEIRGRIQTIRDEIERTGGNLQDWITQEKKALELRIAAIYKAHGKEYNITTQDDKTKALKARDTEVKSRADSIYKSKTRK